MAEKAIRNRLFRALHAEAKKRGLDHDDIRNALGCASMAKASTQSLQQLFHAWTGHNLRERRPLPRRGYVRGDELNLLAAAFAKRGWDEDTRRNFIRRQLSGRETIQTRRDFYRIYSGVRAMNRRDGK